MKFSLLFKSISLAIVTLLLMIGVDLIGNIAKERNMYREHAVSSVRQSLAGPQVIAGPVMTRACVETFETTTETPKGKVIEKQERDRVLRSLPQSTKWTAASAIEPRYRGLYKVNTFRLEAKGDISWSSLEEIAIPGIKTPVVAIRCSAPKLEFAVADPRGIRSIKLDWGGAPLKPQTLSSPTSFAGGFESYPTMTEATLKDPQSARIAMELVGVETLSFVPLGNENLVEMTSDWPHPSFGGAFLPSERGKPNAQGFTAKWSVSSLASNARANFVGGGALCANLRGEDVSHAVLSVRANEPAEAASGASSKRCLQAFGVSFIDPVNPSTLADRATKYALLFIALTFVGIVMFEVTRDAQVHPVQYLLIGAALAVFFLLLLSLSEHISFALAYVIAAVACTGLIGVYVKAVLGGWSRSLPTMVGIGGLYGVLYLVLQSEQHALLAGSLLIFAVLAGVMLLTRRVNWNALSGFGAKLGANAKHGRTNDTTSEAA